MKFYEALHKLLEICNKPASTYVSSWFIVFLREKLLEVFKINLIN